MKWTVLWLVLVLASAPRYTSAEDLSTFELITQLNSIDGMEGIPSGNIDFSFPEEPGPKPSVEDKGRPTGKLIKKIKKNPYNYGYSRAGRILAQRGVEALPPLLEALDGAKDYYRLSLLNILSQIPDPRRDTAFVALTKKLLNEERDFLWDDAAKTLLRAAGENRIREAVPVLRNYLAASDVGRETRAEARIALALLGELDLTALPPTEYEIAAKSEANAVPLHLALLETLLKYELLVGPLVLEEIDSSETEFVVFRGTIENGNWQIRFGTEQSDRIPFYYTWHTGPLSAAGYRGTFEKIDGAWIIVHWRMAWIS